MTTVVADREGMASDSRAVGGDTMINVPKFWRVRGWLIGGAGTASEILHLIEEIKHQKAMAVDEVLRKVVFKNVKDADLLLLSPTGKLYLSESGCSPMLITDPFAAIGSGAQGAMVAMHLGCTLTEAVRTVKKVDPSTGGRIIIRKL